MSDENDAVHQVRCADGIGAEQMPSKVVALSMARRFDSTAPECGPHTVWRIDPDGTETDITGECSDCEGRGGHWVGEGPQVHGGPEAIGWERCATCRPDLDWPPACEHGFVPERCPVHLAGPLGDDVDP